MDHVVQEGRSRSQPPTPSVGGTATLVESPTASPDLRSHDLPQSNIFESTDRKRSSGPMSPISPLDTRHHPLLDRNASPSVPSKPTITFDLASPDIEHQRPHATRRTSSFKFRPRSNSDAPNIGMKPPFRSHHSAGHETPPKSTTDDPQVFTSSHPHAAGGYVNRKTSLSPTKPDPDSNLALAHAKTEHSTASGESLGTGRHDRDEQRSAFMKFIRGLPDFLHGRNSTAAADSAANEEPVKSLPPKRRQKGEVVCMHYGTIDDQGMRQLEGRS